MPKAAIGTEKTEAIIVTGGNLPKSRSRHHLAWAVGQVPMFTIPTAVQRARQALHRSAMENPDIVGSWIVMEME